MPRPWVYHISSFEEMPNPEQFKAEVRTTILSKEDALQWITDFEALSGTNFRVTKTFKENSYRIIFKVRLLCTFPCCLPARYLINNFLLIFKKYLMTLQKCFKCHKNSCKKDKCLKRPSGRNLGCEARLSVTIKNPDMKS